jgi:hypothetical protein
MIHRSFISICLALSAATLLLAAISWRTEVVCWGRENWEKGKWRQGRYEASWQWSPAQPRVSLVKGCLQYVTASIAALPFTRSGQNWILFRWQQDKGWLVPHPAARSMPRSLRVITITMPLWTPFLFFSVYPVGAFIRGRYRRYRRRKKGLCLECAYDLTGNVSGICPECGERI